MEHRVLYNDASHTYWSGGLRYLSATQIVHHFKNEFNVKEAAAAYARNHGNTPEYWIDQWDVIRNRAINRGNKIHDGNESMILSAGLVKFGENVLEVPNPAFLSRSEYEQWPDGVYTELLLWSHTHQIAGRTDKAIFLTEGRKRFMHIEDYKTNKFIRTHSYKDRYHGYRMLKPPVDHLMDCEFYTYALQLSLYLFMGEYLGFSPGTATLIHYPHKLEIAPEGSPDPPPRRIPVPYLRAEVVNMLKSIVYLTN